MAYFIQIEHKWTMYSCLTLFWSSSWIRQSASAKNCFHVFYRSVCDCLHHETCLAERITFSCRMTSACSRSIWTGASRLSRTWPPRLKRWRSTTTVRRSCWRRRSTQNRWGDGWVYSVLIFTELFTYLEIPQLKQLAEPMLKNIIFLPNLFISDWYKIIRETLCGI